MGRQAMQYNLAALCLGILGWQTWHSQSVWQLLPLLPKDAGLRIAVVIWARTHLLPSEKASVAASAAVTVASKSTVSMHASMRQCKTHKRHCCCQ